MHDSLLIEKMYQTVCELCIKNSISKVNEIKINVSLDSHIDGEHMLEHLMERDNIMFGNWTKVEIEEKNIGTLTAVIASICGVIND